VGHGYGCVHIPISSLPCFSRELVYAKSSSRWIASRSRKLSVRFVHVLRVPAPPHRRAAAMCAADITCCLELERLSYRRVALLEQPSSWQRLLLPCVMQWGVPPVAAALVQPSRAGSACLLHARCSARCCGCPGLFLPLSSAVPSPPGVRASNRSWQLSRSLAPA
jgi:hypothetical protein